MNSKRRHIGFPTAHTCEQFLIFVFGKKNNSFKCWQKERGTILEGWAPGRSEWQKLLMILLTPYSLTMFGWSNSERIMASLSKSEAMSSLASSWDQRFPNQVLYCKLPIVTAWLHTIDKSSLEWYHNLWRIYLEHFYSNCSKLFSWQQSRSSSLKINNVTMSEGVDYKRRRPHIGGKYTWKTLPNCPCPISLM